MGTTLAKCHAKANSWRSSWLAAREGAREFLKAGSEEPRAQCMLLAAESDMMCGYQREARETAEDAFNFFTRTNDSEGKEKALVIIDEVNAASGLPTRAQVAYQAQMQQMQREQEMYNQQLLAANQGGAPMPEQPGGLSLLQQQ